MHNLELKAVCRDLDHARAVCDSLGASFEWRRHQADYFYACEPPLRLKLRIEDGESPMLIKYSRPDVQCARESDFEILVIPDCHAKVVAFFGDLLDVKGAVRKTRELYLFEGVRIHLDSVEGLGDFIEFEHPLSCEKAEDAAFRVDRLTAAFGIRREDIVGVAYFDLLYRGEQPAH
ncbi:MAG: CYTH domain-containing protein [Candidatus Brocadiia bacterium]